MKKTFLKILKIILISIVVIHLFIIVFVAISSLFLRFFNPPITGVEIYRRVFFKYKVKKHKYVSVKKLSGFVPRMLIAVEDYKFYKHNGIDFEAIENARKINARIGINMFGGSTLTQQVARTLFLNPDKNFIRKYIEIIIAVEMDFLIPKKRILELYINYAEWGKGIFGIENASLSYFKKSAVYLTKEEAARLLTILSSPIRYTPYNFHKRDFLLQRYNFLMSL
ncbi:MAG TPA: transglycosylase domain-containing protein [Spirochaetota bacterium]|nr:transglycosylase domain-containing protein [Spirochaetota bacterium]